MMVLLIGILIFGLNYGWIPILQFYIWIKTDIFVWAYSFFPFIFISWRLITLQYCSGFCHTLTWNSHGFTYIPHPDPPSHLQIFTWSFWYTLLSCPIQLRIKAERRGQNIKKHKYCSVCSSSKHVKVSFIENEL